MLSQKLPFFDFQHTNDVGCPPSLTTVFEIPVADFVVVGSVAADSVVVAGSAAAGLIVAAVVDFVVAVVDFVVAVVGFVVAVAGFVAVVDFAVETAVV